jgi:hypothetical protein
MRKLQKLLFYLFFGLLPILPLKALAQVDPSIEWKIMRLPHFDLMYDAKHQELANIYADRLEDNLSFLKKTFEVFPDRTVVVLNDRTDLTNGYATPIPYRTIMIYPVLPGPSETITDYGDWERELVMHEFTHILSFEPRRGLVKGLYYTFGSIVTPNLLLPRWWLEGVAVDMETRNSSKGRLRSPLQDAAIRSYVVDNNWQQLTLAEINETSIHTWPQGARPYLFGSLVWSEMITRYGQKLISDLHRSYGGRMPFFIEGPMEELTGADIGFTFHRMQDEIFAKAQKQVSHLRKVPFTEGKKLEMPNALENFSPVISPDGLKMIFLSKGDSNKRSVKILKRPSLQVPFDGSQSLGEINQRIGETLQDALPIPRAKSLEEGLDESDLDAPPGGTIQRLAWFPDSERFIFDKLDNINRYHEVSDLYVFDLNKTKVETLTVNERAREATISPSGKLAAYVQLKAGTTALNVLQLGIKQSDSIYTPGLQVRISNPIFISENEIIFSERVKGREVLKKISLNDKSLSEVLPDYPDARFAQWTAQGLIFTSSFNGTGNVYLASRDLKTARPLTHTATIVTTSALDFSRSELYISELTTNGFQIRNIPVNPQTVLRGPLPVIEPLLADRYPPVERDVPVLAKPTPEDYTIWPYILPHYWLPNLYFYNGGAVIGGSTAGSDPLARHSYSLAATYDTQPRETSYSFLYTNNSTTATVLLKGLDYQTRVVNTALKFRQQDYSANILWQITGLSTDLYAGVGYNWMKRDYFATTSTGQFKLESTGPSILANYSDLTKSGAQISYEGGQAWSLSATDYLQGTDSGGSREDFQLYQASIEKYFSKWLPRHNAILLRAQGQLIEKDVSRGNYNFSVAYNTLPGSSLFLMRGYLHGQFLAKSAANYTFEYRFPIANIYKGAGTTPFFVKRVHGAVIADGITLDGESYNLDTMKYERVDSWKPFWSTGAELKFDLTIGYHFPLTWFFGYYFPLDSKYNKGQQFALGLQL